MQKQKKNLKFKLSIKKLLYSKHLILVNKFIRNKLFRRINFIGFNLKNIKRINAGLNNLLTFKFYRYLKNFFTISGSSSYKHIVTLRFRSNNIFFTIKNKNKNKIKTILSKSAGFYKLNISKKNLKFNQNLFIKYFFKDLKKYLQRRIKFTERHLNYFYLKLIAPTKIRTRIMRQLFLNCKHLVGTLSINFVEKKIFNGCRPKKKT